VAVEIARAIALAPAFGLKPRGTGMRFCSGCRQHDDPPQVWLWFNTLYAQFGDLTSPMWEAAVMVRRGAVLSLLAGAR